jgi:hypothetical protein
LQSQDRETSFAIRLVVDRLKVKLLILEVGRLVEVSFVEPAAVHLNAECMATYNNDLFKLVG